MENECTQECLEIQRICIMKEFRTDHRLYDNMVTEIFREEEKP